MSREGSSQEPSTSNGSPRPPRDNLQSGKGQDSASANGATSKEKTQETSEKEVECSTTSPQDSASAYGATSKEKTQETSETEIGSFTTGGPQVVKTKHKKVTKFKVKPYRRMMLQLEEVLSRKHVSAIAHLTEQSPDFFMQISALDSPFFLLMAQLEKEEIVSEDNFDVLAEILEEIRADEALKVVQRYMESSLKSQRISSETEETDQEGQQVLTAPSQETKQSIDSEMGRGSSQSQQAFPLAGKTNKGSSFIACSWEDVRPVLDSYGLRQSDGKRLSIVDTITIDAMHLHEDAISPDNAVMAFFTRLTSYDYRAMRLFKELEHNVDKRIETLRQTSDKSTSRQNMHLTMSCRDITYAIIKHSDPFLKREVLSKLCACQHAIPLLLSDANLDESRITFLLWGLQGVTKAWKDPLTLQTYEKAVVKHPFPAVTALKYGRVGFSKSNILNKMLGPCQGNDDHPYFFSQEQDSKPSFLSKGTLEAVWCLPGGGKRGRYSLNEAVCFLNLRGDTTEFTKQKTFACIYSLVAVVFIAKTDIHAMQAHIDELSKMCKVILVLGDDANSRGTRENRGVPTVRIEHVRAFDASELNTLDISEKLCVEINDILAQPRSESSMPLEDMVSTCKGYRIDVDVLQPECSEAKELAEDILKTCKEDPKEYKLKALPLQLQWQKWSQLDKDRSWKGYDEQVEKQLSKLYKAKEEQRRLQREIGVSTEMQKLYHGLSNQSDTFKQFLVFWLQHFLNEMSMASLRPLVDALKTIRDEVRGTATKMTHFQRKVGDSTISISERQLLQEKVKELEVTENEQQKELVEKTREFDALSLGFEHFVREFGQIYECFYNMTQTSNSAKIPIDVRCLPKLAAEMLLCGHPLEIFDGDACNVPMKWIKGVLTAVRELLGDVRVYVISVIGIQSSGKSTLLNGMFGVRFAVSAGRCTRGVFLQLLPISKNFKKQVDCDFIAIIDTEGLKAPEKAISNRKNEDNELATFALCISDMTLINIGGQTVGEDLSNILQISAHAFIRMKEVHLRSSCYLIQQFVADVTAEYRNESSTQSILQKLDQAVMTAAVEERKQDQYRQFSDCFNIINVDSRKKSIQYVPSLWRSSSMSAPNYEYSETVLQLKSCLLKGMENLEERKQKISEFANKIDSVWGAVKQEDFVFNFRNTTEISQYNNFTLMYKRQQLHLTQEMVKWELDAKQKIRNSTADNVHDRCAELFHELDKKLASEVEKMQALLEENLQSREYESVRQHANYFYRDLQLAEQQTNDTVRKMLNVESSLIITARTKESQLLPHVIAELRNKVLLVAERLQPTLIQNSDDDSDANLTNDGKQQIQSFFDEEWARQMKTIQLTHPTPREDNIVRRIETDVKMCIGDILQNTSVSKDMKHLLNSRSLSDFCQFSPFVQSATDIEEASRLIGPCNNNISEHINELLRNVTGACSQLNFHFSSRFVQNIKQIFKMIVSTPCDGCGNKTALLACLSCGVLVQGNSATKHNVLTQILKTPSLLQKLGIRNIASEDEIKQDVGRWLNESSSNTSSGFLKRMTNYVGDFLTFWQTVDEKDENFLNTVRRKFYDRISHNGNEKWYSPSETKRFIEMALKLIKNLQLTEEKKRQQLLGDACFFYIHEAIRSEKEKLAQAVSWITVQVELKLEAVSIIDQRNLFVQILQEVLPPKVRNLLSNLSQTSIETYARVPVTKMTRHNLDASFILLAPTLTSDQFERILSILNYSKNLFLTQIKSSGVYNAHLIRSLVTTTFEEMTRYQDLGKFEQALTVAHLCSWALPICIAVQVNFEKENSVEAQLQRERQRLFLEFKCLCEGACKDQLAAKSFCSIIEQSLTESLRNRICTAIFGRLRKSTNDIFCSRPRFLQVVLESLCRDEDFKNYTSFIHHHASFTETWTLRFIATECCDRKKNYIRIKDIVHHELDELVRETEESFESALKSIEETNINKDNILNSLEAWIVVFCESFENRVDSSLDQLRVSELSSYSGISNYSLFTDECKKILKSSTQASLLASVALPDVSSVDQLEEWFVTLPKSLHILLAKSVQGCGARCPFCHTFCDDTIKEHNVHFSNLHYPRGVGGGVYRGSNVLICDTCTALVATNSSGYYNCACEEIECGHPTTLYRDYRIHYPDWDIEPVKSYEPTLYWKWVLMRFNTEFAGYYNGKPGKIPWDTVTKDQALASVSIVND